MSWWCIRSRNRSKRMQFCPLLSHYVKYWTGLTWWISRAVKLWCYNMLNINTTCCVDVDVVNFCNIYFFMLRFHGSGSGEIFRFSKNFPKKADFIRFLRKIRKKWTKSEHFWQFSDFYPQFLSFIRFFGQKSDFEKSIYQIWHISKHGIEAWKIKFT